MAVLSLWAPGSDLLQVEQVTVEAECIIAVVSSRQSAAACPSCGQVSHRAHSHYRRRIADLPWSGRAVEIILHVRRFHCNNAECRQRLFNERLPGVVQSYARRTDRLQGSVVALGQSAGGEGGARLAGALGIAISADTVLRQLKRLSLPPPPTPRVLGVDDFALRRGHRYGTILVDLERHRPVDLLPDREAKTLAAWLKDHPGVEVVARDRAGAYAEGARQGAPKAVQVADRWHLLKNLREAIERLLSRHHQDLRQVSEAQTPVPSPALPPPARAKEPSHAQCLQQARRQRRLERYEQVVTLHQQGLTLRAIARKMHMNRRTVRHFLRADHFPERAPRPPRPGKLRPFLAYLKSRWEQGCHTAATLWREIKAQGFTGCQGLVRRAVQPWRAQQTEGSAQTVVPPVEVPSPRQASWWLLELDKETDEQTEAAQHQHFIEALLQRCPDLQKAKALALPFIDMIRQHQASAFDGWLDTLSHSDVPELHGFAQGLRADQEAVVAGLTLPWSSGQVEGQITRLKCLKRAMYGRAGFELLKERVLHPP